MKKLLLGGIAYVAFAASAASAADLPANAVLKSAAYNWTGCYLGVHGGGGILYAAWSIQNDAGGLAGGQAGCNYQTGPLVVGVEAEGWWSSLTSRNANFGSGFSFNSTSQNRWDVDLALRAGFAVGRALVYGKVGAAWGRFDDSANSSQGLFERGSGTLSGPLFGAGIEYAFGSNWTGKLEYDYIGFLSRTQHIDAGPIAIQSPFDTSVSASEHIFKLGLNYKFGDQVEAAAADMPLKAAMYKGPIYKAPPPAPVYNWTGCYIGVSTGGGTLNDHWIGEIGGGGLAGGQLGCNYQRGAAVVGIEGEGFWSGLASTGGYFRARTYGIFLGPQPLGCRRGLTRRRRNRSCADLSQGGYRLRLVRPVLCRIGWRISAEQRQRHWSAARHRLRICIRRQLDGQA
jgi:outer membrane immunogenic protein